MGNTNTSSIPYGMVGLDILLMKLDNLERLMKKIHHLENLNVMLVETCDMLESQNKELIKDVSSMKRILNRRTTTGRT